MRVPHRLHLFHRDLSLVVAGHTVYAAPALCKPVSLYQFDSAGQGRIKVCLRLSCYLLAQAQLFLLHYEIDESNDTESCGAQLFYATDM